MQNLYKWFLAECYSKLLFQKTLKVNLVLAMQRRLSTFNDNWNHMGPEDPSIRKKYPSFLLMPNFRKLRDDSKYVSLKIGSWKPQKLGPFSSLFLMRKTLSSGQKWFLRPFSPLIRGMFLLRSGLRFSFRALEVPELGVRKRESVFCFSHEENWGKGP